MTDSGTIAKDLERQILDTHDRFSEAMKRRLGTMDLEQKERYFALLSLLVGKLEEGAKPMKQVLQELVSEALPIVLAEIQG